jgi:ApaG protein
MYQSTTNGITITATPKYDAAKSLPKENYHIWEYTINIKNNSDQTTQLLNRRWMIIDETGQKHEVEGEGVVGLQPVLNPREEFEYSSHVFLSTPSGIMLGEYQMTSDQVQFDVEIPTFSLDCPHVKKVMN